MQAILETIDGKLDLVFEVVTTLDRKIDRVEAELQEKIDEDRFKVDLLIKGHAALDSKVDRVHDDLSARIEAVAADLAAHRADTEGHRGAWQVRES